MRWRGVLSGGALFKTGSVGVILANVVVISASAGFISGGA